MGYGGNVSAVGTAVSFQKEIDRKNQSSVVEKQPAREGVNATVRLSPSLNLRDASNPVALTEPTNGTEEGVCEVRGVYVGLVGV